MKSLGTIIGLAHYEQIFLLPRCCQETSDVHAKDSVSHSRKGFNCNSSKKSLKGRQNCIWKPFYVFQFTVRIYDLGSPSRLGENQATAINLIRNQNCPIFQNLPRDITIPRTQQFNTRVYDVKFMMSTQQMQTQLWVVFIYT